MGRGYDFCVYDLLFGELLLELEERVCELGFGGFGGHFCEVDAV